MSKFTHFLRSESGNDIRDKLQKQNDFLEALLAKVMLRSACRSARVSVAEVNGWRRDDMMFRERFEQVKEVTYELIEDEAIRRAYKGWLVPVFGKEGIVGYERKYSDSLMDKVLKARNPAYKDSGANVNGEMSQLLILPHNGTELKHLPPEPDRLEVERENEVDELETIFKKAEENGKGIFNQNDIVE